MTAAGIGGTDVLVAAALIAGAALRLRVGHIEAPPSEAPPEEAP